MTNNNGHMTAYASNTRMTSPARVTCGKRWCARIEQLLREDYSFTGLKYSGAGVLFRGMRSGLSAALRDNTFGCFQGDDPHVHLEQKLGVYFVSQDLSDAVTCARLWEGAEDAGILMIPADEFNRAYDQRSAAMMQFAEPGVVFNYPFFSQPLRIDQIRAVFVNHPTMQSLTCSGVRDKVANPEIIRVAATDRSVCTENIRNCLARNRLSNAMPVPTQDYPGKRS